LIPKSLTPNVKSGIPNSSKMPQPTKDVCIGAEGRVLVSALTTRDAGLTNAAAFRETVGRWSRFGVLKNLSVKETA
jgi:hypothetical protein